MNKEFINVMLERSKDGLVDTFAAVPDDKAVWKPLDNGRTALDLFSDAAQMAGVAAKIVSSRGEFKFSYEMIQALKPEREGWTREHAREMLDTNAAALKEALESCGDEELSLPITMPIRGGFTMPLSGWAMLAHRTYVARFAQINYIQTLYGDFDPH